MAAAGVGAALDELELELLELLDEELELTELLDRSPELSMLSLSSETDDPPAGAGGVGAGVAGVGAS